MSLRRKNSGPTSNITGRLVPHNTRPRYGLKRIVDALNGNFWWEQVLGDDVVQQRRFKETPPLLRNLVQAWLSSGPDLLRFSREQPKMWKDVDRYWKKERRLNPIFLLQAPGGGAGLAMNNREEADPYKEALRLFIELLLNSECDRVAGPCARCDTYYIRIRRSVRNKVYCSPSCGTRATALAATRKRRDEEHGNKIRKAEEAAREWIEERKKNRTKQDWKPWVSRKCPDITVKFLTRAVNKKQLEPPTKGKKL